MWSIIVIARNTFTEVIRQPVFLIILLCSMVLLLISPYINWFMMLENIKMIKDMGLASLLLTGLLISAFSSSNVIYQEIENRTALTVISKPVQRPIFVLGKYFGIFIALLVVEYVLVLIFSQTVRTEITEAAFSKTDYPVLFGYIIALLLTLLLAAYINFFYGKPFTSTAVLLTIPIFTIVFFALCLIDNNWKLQTFAANLDPNVFTATYLVFLATILLSGITVAASCRFAPAATITICTLFFVFGLLSDYLLERHIEESTMAQIFYMLIPNLQIFLVGDALVDDRTIPLSYIGNATIYTCLYLVGTLAIAMAFFQERETY